MLPCTSDFHLMSILRRLLHVFRLIFGLYENKDIQYLTSLMNTSLMFCLAYNLDSLICRSKRLGCGRFIFPCQLWIHQMKKIEARLRRRVFFSWPVLAFYIHDAPSSYIYIYLPQLGRKEILCEGIFTIHSNNRKSILKVKSRWMPKVIDLWGEAFLLQIFTALPHLYVDDVTVCESTLEVYKNKVCKNLDWTSY